jgi:hypothetical protein
MKAMPAKPYQTKESAPMSVAEPVAAYQTAEFFSQSELQKSIEEARNGHYFVAKNAKDAISKCLA